MPDNPKIEQPEDLIQAAEVRRIFGGISDMSLWRWLADPALDFPKPIKIARRRFWRSSEIAAWQQGRTTHDE